MLAMWFVAWAYSLPIRQPKWTKSCEHYYSYEEMQFMETRSLDYRDERSEKSWNITRDSSTVSVHLGPTTI